MYICLVYIYVQYHSEKIFIQTRDIRDDLLPFFCLLTIFYTYESILCQNYFIKIEKNFNNIMNMLKDL